MAACEREVGRDEELSALKKELEILKVELLKRGGELPVSVLSS